MEYAVMVSNPESKSATMTEPKVVFALTSAGIDFYSAMTRIAVASLRLTNPGIRVVVACDAETDRLMRQARDPLLNEVDKWMSVETPYGNKNNRSRFVKTSLRNRVEGAFLFLDSDVLVRGDLSPLFTSDADIAGVRNHCLPFAQQIWAEDAETLEVMGWRVRDDAYINTGVLYFNNTQATRRFGEEWHRHWLLSSRQRKLDHDQPAFNTVLHELRPHLAVLPDAWNAQFVKNASVVKDALIWHYYATISGRPDTEYVLFVEDMLSGKPLDPERVKDMLNSPHPWRRRMPGDDWVARRALQRGRLYSVEAAWFRRDLLRWGYRTVRRLAGWQARGVQVEGIVEQRP